MIPVQSKESPYQASTQQNLHSANSTDNLSTLTFFEMLHHKNAEHHTNIRGMVNHEYNRLLDSNGLSNHVIPGGENIEELGLDRLTSIVRPDLYFQAYKKILGNFNDYSPLALKATTKTFFNILHEENLKHQANIRGKVNQLYNSLLITGDMGHDKIPGGDNLESLGMDQTTFIVAPHLYLKAYGEILAGHEKTQPQNNQTYPKLEFDQPVILLLHEVLELNISTRSYRSDIEEYRDSTFEVISQPGHYTVTRRRSSNNPNSSSQITPISTISLPSKRELIVSEVAPNAETLKKIGEIAREWQSTAANMHPSARQENQIFRDLRTISKLIKECMQNPKETSWIWNKIYICKDSALGEIQAIALTKDSTRKLKVSHLATHPRNVRSSLNQNETTRVEGAGSAIMNHLISNLKPSQTQIYLESVESAKLFYQKIGFDELDPIQHPPVEFDAIPMVLSKEKIKSLIKKSA